MVTKSEFYSALDGFVHSSAKVKTVADNVIAVANVDVSRINEGFHILLTWTFKIVAMIMDEINKTPVLREKMIESGRLLAENSGVIFGSDVSIKLLHAISNVALMPLVGKLLNLFGSGIHMF